MTEDKGILIQNLYHMLAYAFQVLRQTHYEEIRQEKFEHVHDLFAAILAKGLSQQLKQGLYRSYIPQTEALTVLRGKLNIQETMRSRMQNRQCLACEYDELSANNPLNQILKTTVLALLAQPDVKRERKDALRKLMLFFDGIDAVQPSQIRWNALQYQRDNQNYRMLMNLCYFVLKGLILSTEKGTYKMAAFLDAQQMHSLFERFVLEYYRAHHPHLRAAASHVAWNLDEESEYLAYLPEMKTDITLRSGGKTLIIDAKYYRHAWQSHHERQSLRSAHLYQIFAYVKNMDRGHTGEVSGLLLYARTGEALSPDSEFMMDGNRIVIRSLDLNRPFAEIAAQLDEIAGMVSV